MYDSDPHFYMSLTDKSSWGPIPTYGNITSNHVFHCVLHLHPRGSWRSYPFHAPSYSRCWNASYFCNHSALPNLTCWIILQQVWASAYWCLTSLAASPWRLLGTVTGHPWPCCCRRCRDISWHNPPPYVPSEHSDDYYEEEYEIETYTPNLPYHRARRYHHYIGPDDDIHINTIKLVTNVSSTPRCIFLTRRWCPVAQST